MLRSVLELLFTNQKVQFVPVTYVTNICVHARVLLWEGAATPKVTNVTFGVGSASIGGGAALLLNP